MATLFSNTISPDTSTNAKFRAIAQFMEDTLVSVGGWQVSADTGQTLPSALITPTGSNSKNGYRIYKMTDALAATAPVFVRIDYSGNSGNTGNFGFWITIGTGSDGAGNITNILHNGGARVSPYCTNPPPSGIQRNSYGSAFHERFTFSLFTSDGFSGYQMGLERSRDPTGAVTSDGLIFFWMDYTYGGNYPGPSFIRYMILAGGTQPNVDTGLNYCLSVNSQTETWIPGDVQAALPFPFKGVAQQPGMNLLILNSSDVSNEGRFQAHIYGGLHTYQHCAGSYVYKGLSGQNANADNNSRCAIRYE